MKIVFRKLLPREFILMLVGLAVGCALAAHGQTIITIGTNGIATTNEVPASPAQPFISQLAQWVTAYNTNLYWTNGISIDDGVATTTGEQIADKLEMIYSHGNFELGASGEFVGVGSTWNQFEGIVGYALINKYDFKFCAELGAGYDFNRNDSHGIKVGAIEMEPGIAAYKMITQQTYLTAKYSFPIESVGKFNGAGTVYIGAGFTF